MTSEFALPSTCDKTLEMSICGLRLNLVCYIAIFGGSSIVIYLQDGKCTVEESAPVPSHFQRAKCVTLRSGGGGRVVQGLAQSACSIEDHCSFL